MPPSPRRNANESVLRDLALAYPETHEDFPWGHRAIKVRGKAFVFMSQDEPGLSLSVKLPWSAEGALQFAFCEPTHYGLGRSGWVTATFGPKDAPPLEMLRSWIDESYRAVAPKRLVARLEGQNGVGAPRSSPASRAPPAKASGPAKSRSMPRRRSSAGRPRRAAQSPARQGAAGTAKRGRPR
jgi:predicted DNA-binding protein (MmcQ/YjbR family)